MTGSGGINTITQAISGVGMSAELPGGMLEDQTTLGSVTPEPGTFTTATSSLGFVLSAALTTASTSTTMTTYKPALVGSSTAAKVYPLSAPGTAGIGVYKYIRCRSGTTSRTTKIKTASGNINNTKTVITLHNTGDSVLMFGETSANWGIAGSFVAGTTRIATS